MKKYTAILLALIMVLSLTACHAENGVLDEIQTYEITANIHSLDIELNAASFTIEYGDEFMIESNLKNLTVSENRGVLTVVDKIKTGVTYNDAKLILRMPQGIVLKDVEITTGAANLTAEHLSADSLTLKLGAGNVEFGCLNAYKHSQIKGGAGQITVSSGTLQDLSLELGVGRLDLTAALPGSSELTLGVGESSITLIGHPDDYKLDIEEGIGSVTIDRTSGSGSSDRWLHRVEIEGGIGSANVAFCQE